MSQKRSAIILCAAGTENGDQQRSHGGDPRGNVPRPGSPLPTSLMPFSSAVKRRAAALERMEEKLFFSHRIDQFLHRYDDRHRSRRRGRSVADDCGSPPEGTRGVRLTLPVLPHRGRPDAVGRAVYPVLSSGGVHAVPDPHGNFLLNAVRADTGSRRGSGGWVGARRRKYRPSAVIGRL